ncbi:hypothetical protein ACFWP3_04340 [Streptomyces sp. NPDC058525]|uniref:hypothetical protein n=1 Tax=Streptomyces sp. NPDC058525 TaxID=3346538 RepID=UPI00365C38E8
MPWNRAKELYNKILPGADPGSLAFDLAVAVSADARCEHKPLMGITVNPPSSGKTVSQEFTPRDRVVGDVTKAGIFGAEIDSKTKEVRPTGILAQLGNGCEAVVHVPDISQLVANSAVKEDIYALLRDVHDGHAVRTFNGVDIQWSGRVSFCVCATGVGVDQPVTGLGERFIYYRPFPGSLAWREARKIRDNSPAVKTELKRICKELVKLGRENYVNTKLPDDLDHLIEDCADFTAMARTAVPRDRYYRDVNGPVEREEPFRLANCFEIVGRSLLAMGVPEAEVAEVVRRVATSTVVPALRLDLIRAVHLDGVHERFTTYLDVKRTTTDRTLEDLVQAGVFYEVPGGRGRGNYAHYYLTEEFKTFASNVLI